MGLTKKSAVRGVVEAVGPVVLLQFSGLSLFLGFTAAASFRFLLAGVSCRLKGTRSRLAVYFSVLPLVLWL